jgi:hypothetical protein
MPTQEQVPDTVEIVHPHWRTVPLLLVHGLNESPSPPCTVAKSSLEMH